MFRWPLVLVAAVVLSVVIVGGSAWGANPFTDVAGNAHADNIDAIYNAGITAGCSQGPTFYCPGDNVTRAQMASFLARLGGLSSGNTRNFPKVNGRGETQSYCSIVAANPDSYSAAPCMPSAVTVDGVNTSVGGASSIAIGTDGLPVISYFDASNGNLKVAHCTTPTCSLATTTTPVSAGNVGLWSSIAIGVDGLPIISHQQVDTADLLVTHCGDITCSAGNTTTPIDTPNETGIQTSIAIGEKGRAVIAYYDHTAGALRFVRCGNVACSAGNLQETIDTGMTFGADPAIARGADGMPIISYHHNVSDELRVAHCSDLDCDASTIATLAPGGRQSAIAIGTDGRPVISYVKSAPVEARLAHCDNTACSSSTSVLIDSPVSISDQAVVTIGSDGFPVVASVDKDDAVLRVADCSNLTCSVKTARQVDTVTAPDLAIALGPDGVPVVSYWDATNTDLKVARPQLIG